MDALGVYPNIRKEALQLLSPLPIGGGPPVAEQPGFAQQKGAGSDAAEPPGLLGAGAQIRRALRVPHGPLDAIDAHHDERVQGRRVIRLGAVEGEAGRVADRTARHRKYLETVLAGCEPFGDREHGGRTGRVEDLEVLE